MRFTLCPVYPAERGQLPTKNPLPRRGEGLRSLHRSDGGHAAPGWVGFHQKTPLKSPLVQGESKGGRDFHRSHGNFVP
jgi:hypothetical protein